MAEVELRLEQQRRASRAQRRALKARAKEGAAERASRRRAGGAARAQREKEFERREAGQERRERAATFEAEERRKERETAARRRDLGEQAEMAYRYGIKMAEKDGRPAFAALSPEEREQYGVPEGGFEGQREARAGEELKLRQAQEKRLGGAAGAKTQLAEEKRLMEEIERAEEEVRRFKQLEGVVGTSMEGKQWVQDRDNRRLLTDLAAGDLPISQARQEALVFRNQGILKDSYLPLAAQQFPEFASKHAQKLGGVLEYVIEKGLPEETMLDMVGAEAKAAKQTDMADIAERADLGMASEQERTELASYHRSLGMTRKTLVDKERVAYGWREWAKPSREMKRYQREFDAAAQTVNDIRRGSKVVPDDEGNPDARATDELLRLNVGMMAQKKGELESATAAREKWRDLEARRLDAMDRQVQLQAIRDSEDMEAAEPIAPDGVPAEESEGPEGAAPGVEDPAAEEPARPGAKTPEARAIQREHVEGGELRDKLLQLQPEIEKAQRNLDELNLELDEARAKWETEEQGEGDLGPDPEAADLMTRIAEAYFKLRGLQGQRGSSQERALQLSAGRAKRKAAAKETQDG